MKGELELRFVLDCSVTMAWLFKEQASDYTESILKLLGQNTAIVPMIWPLEVANVLLLGERKQLFTEVHIAQFTRLLKSLPITVEYATTDHTLDTLLALARAHGLSSYDAAYLELALRTGIPLATRDKKLVSACQRSGVGLAGNS